MSAPPPLEVLDDAGAMQLALAEAQAALAHDDVPVGAVVIHAGQLVGRGHNRREVDADPLAHAELLALAEAARTLGRWRLSGCSLVVTLEPCPMCAGALVNARVDRLIYATADPRAGACGTVMDIARDPRLNHRLEVIAGVEAEAAARLLTDFFRARR